MTATSTGAKSLPRASTPDTLRAAAIAIAPMLAQGVIARRPRMVELAGRLGTDRRSVRLLQEFRRRYGPGPLRLRVPFRSVALVLSPEHVHRVLDGSPEPFALANVEKRGALNHFQPRGVLVSHGANRADRRRFNEDVLDTGNQVHRMADRLVGKAGEEADELLRTAESRNSLVWNDFAQAWRRAIRRIVLGDAARDDRELTALLTELRYDANWAYLRPKRGDVRERFTRRLQEYLDAAEPGSLAELVAAAPSSAETAPVEQVPQWLFASDPAGMATYRALALLAAHPDQAGRVRAELTDRDLARPQDLPLTRASVLESVRLWPTTAVVLRDSTTETEWDAGTLPAGTATLILSSFFHRDDEVLPQADRFDPQAWLDGRAEQDWSLFPFSGGPGTCPGRELVLFTASTVLGKLLRRHDFRLSAPALRPEALPAALNPFAVRFAVSAR
ncbi:MAG: cytochrome P450 [Saccharopolyspora sp.]|uniref:cytochrome P450 n=1 Tax=Saccharopolyspora sp. TaxID=33915 RepID=UPI0025D8B27B|nr:cytochrome P450 [Saccharopolyspora sp.]MBQ6644388.1 cytochrome P450 [Saccharopolyspora sp.]